MRGKVLIALAALFLLCSTGAKADDVTYAYCPLGEGYVFLYDSLTGFDVLANLKCGARLTVVDPGDNNRVRVRTEDGKQGYVLRSSITAGLPGSQRQAAASQTPNDQQPKPKTQQQSQLQLQPEPQSQPLPKPQQQPEPEPKAQLESKAQPQPATQPTSKPQLDLLPLPRVEILPLRQLDLPPTQPQTAATAFRPFPDLGYEEEVPRLEAFAGYSLLNVGTTAVSNRQNVTGLESSMVFNLNGWLGGEANVSGYYKTVEILNVGTFGFHDYAIMGGPRFRLSPAFFHGLIGIDHVTGSTNFFQVSGPPSNTALAAAFGGGVQWKISRQLALRTSADYVLSRFEGLTQANFRVTAGIVFEAGSVSSRGR